MKNPFEKLDINYFSPSSINKFRRDPAKWLVNIAGYKDNAYSPAMTFGTCVEQGITVGCLTHAPMSICIDSANKEYEKIHNKIKSEELANPYDFDKCKEKQNQIERVLEAIIPLYRKFGKPVSAQQRVEVDIGLPIPIIGYIDMLYEDTVRDIKTTGVQPKVRNDYERQLALYSTATDVPPYIDAVYVTKHKVELHTFKLGNVEKHFADLVRIATKMTNLVSKSEDIKEVAQLSCLEPDLSNEDFMKQWGVNEIAGAIELFEL